MKYFKWILIFVAVLIALFVFRTCNFFVSDATQTAKEEFAPSAMLKKYEWFKDASSQLEKKLKDIAVYEANIATMKVDYSGIRRIEWDRTDKEQFNQWNTELVGVKASYNSLAAEYNSQSSKFNWSMFETDIPTEYKTFVGL